MPFERRLAHQATLWLDALSGRRMKAAAIALFAGALVGGCSGGGGRGEAAVERERVEAEAPDERATAEAPAAAPAEARAREAPAGATDAEAAAQVARDYFAAIGERRYEAAFRMLGDGAAPPGSDVEDFAAAFAEYADYRAEIGPPGRVEGAAGSLYVEVPARVSGRMKDGETFEAAGVVLLRRCNAVPGCTAEQRSWRIEAENLRVE